MPTMTLPSVTGDYVRYIANATPTVDTCTITVGGTYANGQTYSLVLNDKTVAYTSVAGDTDNDGVATKLGTLLNSNSQTTTVPPEFREYTYSVSGSVITASAKVAGMPIGTITAAATGTGSLTYSHTVVGTGPSDASNVDNYDTGALPAAGDALIFENLPIDVLYGLESLASVANIAQLHILNCSGKFGLPKWSGTSSNGSDGYWQYRPNYFKIKAEAIIINSPKLTRIWIDNQNVSTSILIYAMGQSDGSDSVGSLVFKGTGTTNKIQAYAGSIDVAPFTNESSTISEIKMIKSSGGVTPKIKCSSGVTLTNVYLVGSEGNFDSATTVLDIRDESKTCIKGGTHASVQVWRSSVVYQSSGTVTTLVLGTAGTWDERQNPNTHTITNAVQMYPESKFLDPFKKATSLSFTTIGQDKALIDRGDSVTVTKN